MAVSFRVKFLVWEGFHTPPHFDPRENSPARPGFTVFFSGRRKISCGAWKNPHAIGMGVYHLLVVRD